MIVIAVLGVLAILMVLVFNLSADAGLASQMMVRIQERDRAAYVAQSAVSAAVRMLGRNGPHTLLDPWAMFGTMPLNLDGYSVTIQIIDEERFFNPNYASDTSQDSTDRARSLRRMMILTDQNPDFANTLLDWIDLDSNRREPGGAENAEYPNRPCKNAPLDSVDEIAYVKGATGRLMNGIDTPNRKVPGLRNLLTVWSNGKINVNTAPAVVLQCLSENLDENVVHALIDRRSRQPFRSMEDLLQVPGFTPDRLYDFKKVCTVNSATWRIEAAVTSGPDPDAQRMKLICVYRTGTKGFRPIFWNLEEVGDEPSASPSPGASPSASPSTMPSPSGTTPFGPGSPFPFPSGSGLPPGSLAPGGMPTAGGAGPWGRGGQGP